MENEELEGKVDEENMWLKKALTRQKSDFDVRFSELLEVTKTHDV